MKNKIKEALKQGHKKLGVSDEVFERVAASVETFITDESQIAGFVASENTLNLLKSYQSMADKIRDLERINPNNEPNPKPSEPGNQPNPNSNPEPPKDKPSDEVPAWAQALIDSNKALSEELANFKTEQSAKSAFTNAESAFKSNDYVKKFADEATDAWERATEMYEATGKKWSSEELQEKAMGYFNKAVSKKGVDTSKPFESNGGSGETDADFSSFDKAAKKLGWEMPQNQPNQ